MTADRTTSAATHDAGVTVTRLMTAIGIAVATVVALVVPSSYYAISVGGARQSLRIETAAVAHNVEDVVRANPEMWEYEAMRLFDLASQEMASGDHAEERIVRDASGTVIARTVFQAPYPIVAETVPVYDSGQVVGSVEGRRSIAPIVGGAALMAIAGSLLGLSVFIVYRSWPIRILNRTILQLSSEKRKSDAMLQAIEDGVVAIDADGRITLINRGAERLLGWPSEAAVGRPLEEVYLVRREPQPRPGRTAPRTILQAEDGIEHLIEEARSAIPEKDGREGCVIVFRDVTERARIEEEFLRGRQVESIGLLAAGIAHDFNNFLTGILGNLALARIHAEGNAKALERLEEAERATLRARELAQKLLTFAKGGESARAVVDPELLASEAARFAARGTAVKTSVEAQDGLWCIEADPGQITQVVNNIVLNSVQAIDGRGAIRIRLANREVGNGEIAHVKPGRYVVARIEDSGPGIPEEVLPRIFDPYFTTKPQGTGLGLATCYNIMKAHGGNIFAESSSGRGTTFTLYLPATDRLVPGAAGTAERGTLSAGEQGRILVMDDEPMIRELAKELLSHMGYQVVLCETGEEAVEEYARAARANLGYDAAILDLTIPGGIGGQEAARKILSRFPEARLIVSSGYSNHPVLAHPAEYGFRGAVTKPYRIEDFGRTVKAVLQGTGTGQTTA